MFFRENVPLAVLTKRSVAREMILRARIYIRIRIFVSKIYTKSTSLWHEKHATFEGMDVVGRWMVFDVDGFVSRLNYKNYLCTRQERHTHSQPPFE